MQQPKSRTKRTVFVEAICFFCVCCIFSTVVNSFLLLQYPSTCLSSTSRIGSSTNNNVPRICCQEAPYLNEKLHFHLFSTLFNNDEFDWDDEENYEELDNFDIQVESLVKMSDDYDLEQQVDDTDDSYYERLFLQQERDITTDNKQQLSNLKPRENEKMERNVHQKNPTSQQLTYDDIVSLRNEWREKIDQMRNEATEMRKIIRYKNRQLKMKEYASFLALRALRFQSMMIQSEQQKSMGVTVRPLSETLPISSMLRKNYNKETIDKMDNPSIRLEQKMYGKRFKNAQKVFLRLLEVLDEMKTETRRIASEMITNRVEEELAFVSSSHRTENFSQSSMENRILPGDELTNKNHLEDIVVMNKNHHLRLRRLVHLSLNGYHKEDTFKLSDVDTEDLRAILRIRGNFKRRGRMPTERTKVLQCLEESFSLPLF